MKTLQNPLLHTQNHKYYFNLKTIIKYLCLEKFFWQVQLLSPALRNQLTYNLVFLITTAIPIYHEFYILLLFVCEPITYVFRKPFNE